MLQIFPSNFDYLKILSQFELGEIVGTKLFGGSLRDFYRISTSYGNIIFLFDSNRSELIRYSRLLRSLHNENIPVPIVYAISLDSNALILEDAGKILVRDWIRQHKDFSIYFEIIEKIAKFHSLENVDGAIEREFNKTDFMYETNYFIRHFLIRYIGLAGNVWQYLKDEFTDLASKASNSIYGFMHRDLQSENILLSKNGIKIVDLQSARKGPRAYDLASLLEDPYVAIPNYLKRKLLREYFVFSKLNHLQVKKFLNSYPRTMFFSVLCKLLLLLHISVRFRIKVGSNNLSQFHFAGLNLHLKNFRNFLVCKK
jgi:aminoglycoside/choline kinase family phosphotransferase